MSAAIKSGLKSWRARDGLWEINGAIFAPLRLGENRRLNKEARFSQRRKGAKAAKEKRPLLWSYLFLNINKSAPLLRRSIHVALRRLEPMKMAARG